WILAIYLTVGLFIIIYIFSIAYRYHAQLWLESRSNILNQQLLDAQSNFQSSIPLWQQGLLSSYISSKNYDDDDTNKIDKSIDKFNDKSNKNIKSSNIDKIKRMNNLVD